METTEQRSDCPLPPANLAAAERAFDLRDLLDRYLRRTRPGPGRLINLGGFAGYDAYNPSNPIPNGGHPYAYVRTEPRHDEYATWSVPFRQVTHEDWELEHDAPMLPLQDPFATSIGSTIVLGGVRIVSRSRSQVVWETVFLRGSSVYDLDEFARGPRCMKDIRLAALPDGRIGVFTRPLGGTFGRGKIAYTELDDLSQLTPGRLEAAELLDVQPIPEQWWGPNQIYVLDNRRLGVLAHAACFDGADRHYYAVTFTFDRIAREVVSGPDIIADRACFPAYPAKRPDLHNVVFPSWIDRERGLLYGGISDSAIGLVAIQDPFAD